MGGRVWPSALDGVLHLVITLLFLALVFPLQPHAPPTIPSIICPHRSPSPSVLAPLHLSPAPSTFSPSWLEASTGEGSVLLHWPSPPLLLSFTMHFISSMLAQTSPGSSSSRPYPFLGLAPPLLPSSLPASLGLPPPALSPLPRPRGSHFHLRPAPAHRLRCQPSWPYSALCPPFLPTALWTWLASPPQPRKNHRRRHPVGVKTCSM